VVEAGDEADLGGGGREEAGIWRGREGREAKGRWRRGGFVNGCALHGRRIAMDEIFD